MRSIELGVGNWAHACAVGFNDIVFCYVQDNVHSETENVSITTTQAMHFTMETQLGRPASIKS